MENFKGTPGPWEIQPNVKTLVCTIGKSRSICTTGNWSDSTRPFETDLENEANAKLIAAAPELLDALQKCVKLLKQNNMECYETKDAEAAINKALNGK